MNPAAKGAFKLVELICVRSRTPSSTRGDSRGSGKPTPAPTSRSTGVNPDQPGADRTADVRIRFGCFENNGFALALSNNYIIWRVTQGRRKFTRAIPWFVGFERSIVSLALEPGPDPLLLIVTEDHCVYSYNASDAGSRLEDAATASVNQCSHPSGHVPSLLSFARNAAAANDAARAQVFKNVSSAPQAAGVSTARSNRVAATSALNLVLDLKAEIRRLAHALKPENMALAAAWRSAGTGDLHLTLVLRSGFAIGINITTRTVVSNIALGFAVRLASINSQRERPTSNSGSPTAGHQSIFLVTASSGMSVLTVSDRHDLCTSNELKFSDRVLSKVADMSLQTLRDELGVGLLSANRRMQLFQASTGFVLFEYVLPCYPTFVKYSPQYTFLVSVIPSGNGAVNTPTNAGSGFSRGVSYITVISNHNAQRKHSRGRRASNAADLRPTADGWDPRQCIIQEFVISDTVVHVQLMRSVVSRKRNDRTVSSEAAEQQNQDEVLTCYDLLLMTHTAVRKLRISRHLDKVFLDNMRRSEASGRSMADVLGKTLQLDLLSLYEQAAAQLLQAADSFTPLDTRVLHGAHQASDFHTRFLDILRLQLEDQGLALYRESNAHVSKLIHHVARIRGPDAVFEYLRPLLATSTDSSALPATARRKVATFCAVSMLFSKAMLRGARATKGPTVQPSGGVLSSPKSTPPKYLVYSQASIWTSTSGDKLTMFENFIDEQREYVAASLVMPHALGLREYEAALLLAHMTQPKSPSGRSEGAAKRTARFVSLLVESMASTGFHGFSGAQLWRAVLQHGVTADSVMTLIQAGSADSEAALSLLRMTLRDDANVLTECNSSCQSPTAQAIGRPGRLSLARRIVVHLGLAFKRTSAVDQMGITSLRECVTDLVKQLAHEKKGCDALPDWELLTVVAWLASTRPHGDATSQSTSIEMLLRGFETPQGCIACASTVFALCQQWKHVLNMHRQCGDWFASSVACAASMKTPSAAGCIASFSSVFEAIPPLDRAPTITLLLIELAGRAGGFNEKQGAVTAALLENASLYMTALGTALFAAQSEPVLGHGTRSLSQVEVCAAGSAFLQSYLPVNPVQSHACLAYVRELSDAASDQLGQPSRFEELPGQDTTLLAFAKGVRKNSPSAAGTILGSRGGALRMEVEADLLDSQAEPFVIFTCGHMLGVAQLRGELVPSTQKLIDAQLGRGSPASRVFWAKFKTLSASADVPRATRGDVVNSKALQSACPACVAKAMLQALPTQ